MRAVKQNSPAFLLTGVIAICYISNNKTLFERSSTSEKVSQLVFQGREPGGLDPLGPDDNLRRLRFYNDIQRRNAWRSPAPAFLVGVVFIGFGIWMLLSAPAYLGFALVSLGIGVFFTFATGLMLWADARRRQTNRDR